MATAALAVSQQAVSWFTGLWQGHEIRARDAQNENAAVSQIIPQWDAMFAAIINSYNTGEASADQCLQALETMDAQTQQELHQFVGKPGTSWDTVPPQRCGDGAANICTKTCTVGCCVYKAYLSRPLDCAYRAIYAGSSRSVSRATIAGSKYGLPNFPGYTLQISARPSSVSSAEGTLSSITAALGFGGGSGQTLIGGGYSAPAGTLATATGSAPDFSKLLLYGGAALLILLLLFGGGRRAQ